MKRRAVVPTALALLLAFAPALALASEEGHAAAEGGHGDAAAWQSLGFAFFNFFLFLIRIDSILRLCSIFIGGFGYLCLLNRILRILFFVTISSGRLMSPTIIGAE